VDLRRSRGSLRVLALLLFAFVYLVLDTIGGIAHSELGPWMRIIQAVGMHALYLLYLVHLARQKDSRWSE